MSHQPGNAFVFGDAFFTKPFPYRKNRENYSLNGIEVPGSSRGLALDAVLQQIDIESLVHAFY